MASGRALERRISLQTGRLQLMLQDAETGEPASRASVVLVLASEAAGQKPSAWRQLPSYTSLRSRDGKVDSRDIKPGAYAYSVFGRGLAETNGQITVAAGDSNVPTIVKVEKGDGTSSTSRRAEMVERLDKNADGKLSKEELGRLGDRMMAADTNGDGAISKEELAAWTKKRQAEREAERAKGGAQGSGRGGSAGGTQRGGGRRRR